MRAEAGRHCTAVATLRTMWGPGRNSARPVPRQQAGPMTCSDRRCTLARTYGKNLKTVVRGCRWLHEAQEGNLDEPPSQEFATPPFTTGEESLDDPAPLI